MSNEKRNKFWDLFSFGGNDDYEDESDYFDDEEDEAPVRSRRENVSYDEDKHRKSRKPRVIQVNNSKAPSSVVIYSPKTYNDAQPLVMQLIQNKQVIIKLDKVERRVAQRILDFMSGAAYASDAQVTEVSKGSIYLFASNQTYIDKSEDIVNESELSEAGFTLDEDF